MHSEGRSTIIEDHEALLRSRGSENKMEEVNKSHVAMYAFVSLIPGFLQQYSMTYLNQMAHYLNVRFEWDTVE